MPSRYLSHSQLVLLLLATALIASAAPPARAGTISLAWDPVSHPQLAGYRVYHGPSSGSYTQTVDVGLSPQATLTVSDCADYFIAVKARTTDGTESVLFSNEISGWARPEVTAGTPASVERNQTVDVTIDGMNFRAGASVQLGDPAISVNSVTVNGCSQLVANLTVGAGAAIGPVDVQVVNPDGSSGTGAGLISVVADTTAPAISSVQAVNIGSTAASITWDTDEPADSQVSYREVGETAYQNTGVDPSLVTSHSVSLTGLAPSTEYEFQVHSADGDGNASTANGAATFTTSANGYTYTRFEAESGPPGPPAEVTAGAGAFAGAWINLAAGTASGNPNNPSGTWDYGFHVPSSGTWQIWFRMYGVSSNRNAWLEEVDGGGLALIVPSQNGAWEWVAGRSYTLSAGLHTLTLGGAEAEARIDRILITDDPAFLPSEQPGGDVTPPGGVTALSANAGDGFNNLSWTHPADGDLARVVVRYRTDGLFPVSPADGLPLLDRVALPGASDSFDHLGLTNGTTYHYSVFAIDGSGNASTRATVDAMPQTQTSPPGQVRNLRRTDGTGS